MNAVTGDLICVTGELSVTTALDPTGVSAVLDTTETESFATVSTHAINKQAIYLRMYFID